MDKKYSREVTERFLEASETLIAKNNLTKFEYAKSIGINSSNLLRMAGNIDNNVTLESLCIMIYTYKVSPTWLFLAAGDVFAEPQTEAAKATIVSRVTEMETSVNEIKQALKTLKGAINRKR